MSKKLELLNKQIQVKTKLAQTKAARELAALIPELIKLRTRQAGEGVDGALKSLAESTIEYREKYEDNLHPDTSPSNSNLTATGQLLDAIQGKNTGSKVRVDIKGGKRKSEISGGKSKKTNKDVRKYVEDAGRKFLELSEAEKDEVIELARQIILDELRSVIK
jgi:hypothetical protein